MPAVRVELLATLEETLRLQQRLMDDVREDDVPVADLSRKSACWSGSTTGATS